VAISADIRAGVDMTGTLTMGREFPKEGPVEEVVAWVLRKLEDHDRDIDELREGAGTTARKLSAVEEAERSERSVAVEGLNQRIERLAGDGLRVTALGVLLLAAGTVLLAVSFT